MPLPTDPRERQKLLRRLSALLFIIAAAVCTGIGTGNAWLGWSAFFALSVLCDIPYARMKD